MRPNTTVDALVTLKYFMPKDELRMIWNQSNHSDERQYFRELLQTQAEIIDNMPATYDQDGQGDEAIAYLHYFGPSYDAYITEKDCGDEEDEHPEQQHQAYGFARFAHMPEGAGVGYISIHELIESGIELDLHFTPMTIREIKTRYALREEGIRA